MVSSASEAKDVLVVGGGPAGSTAAGLLAREGYRVLLLEKERFPRVHVGESMLPFCFPLFEDLGVLEEMAARFVRKPGVRFVDRFGNASTTWCFSHVIHDVTHLSFQVDRSQFDQVLLGNARQLGAEVREGTRVTDVNLSDPDQVVATSVDAEGRTETHRARFLIDASGRDALVGTRNGWRTPRAELDRTALWSHWTGVTMAGGLEEGLSLIIYLGEEKKGWIWVFPLTADRVTAGVVMQNSYIRDQRRLLQEREAPAGPDDWKERLCMQELTLAPFVQRLLEGSERAIPIIVNGDYSYEVRNNFGPNYAMIGDARGFIDPIFSSGVFLSMKTAFLVSGALRRALSGAGAGRGQGLGDTEDMAAAYRMVTGAYGFVHRMIRLFYNPHAITWAEAGADGQAHKRHEASLAMGHFMLAGDFFEHHERYNRFFDLLQDPEAFRRYRVLAIDSHRFPEDSCRVPPEVAFGGQRAAAAASPGQAH